MKKIAIFLCLSVFLLVGCEKKTPELPPISGDLKVWVSGTEAYWDALSREFVSLFETPNLTVEVIPFESDEELQTTFLNSLAEGRGPDVIFTDADWIAHNTGKFVPLVEDESLTVEKLQQFFVPAVSELLVHHGMIWGVPMSIDTLAVVYNAGHFAEQFGEEVGVGETWEAFRKQVEALNKRNNSFQRFARSGAAMGRTDNVVRGRETFLNLFVQLIGDLFSDDGMEAIFADNKGVTATGERVDFALQALKFYLGFANPSISYHSWNELLVDSDAQYKDFEAFVAGDVSMVFAMASDIPDIETLFEKGGDTMPQNDMRIGFLPQFESTEPREVLATVQGLAVSVSSPKPQLAWQFLKFSLSPDSLQGYFHSTGIPSPHTELLLQQESTPNAEIFVRQAKTAQGHLFPFPRTEIMKHFDRMLSRIQKKKASPVEGLSQGDAILTKQLQRRSILLQLLSQ